jgi:RNA polymerase sigma factor (TIGR02999 family)
LEVRVGGFHEQTRHHRAEPINGTPLATEPGGIAIEEEPMADEKTGDVTRALRAWRRDVPGDDAELMELVYGELHRMAERQLRGERKDHTLQATALVHEAYLRLREQRRVDWHNRHHFFAVSARVMRRILVDHARARCREKRGGADRKTSLEDAFDLAVETPPELLGLDLALQELARIDPFKEAVVELRYFGGFTAEESGEILGVSEPTVRRHWRLAKAWLYRALTAVR